MNLKVLGSGSSGNCYLIEANDNEKLILDAGVKFKIVQKELNFNFNGIKAVLITHEHMDHLKYATNFALYGIDIYASAGTFKKQNLVGHRFKIIKALNQFEIGNFVILPFDTQHDAAEPLGFLIQHKITGEKLLYATDTYYIKYKFNKLNYLLLECNYNKEIAKENAKNGVINKTRYSRLLESHFSLENVIKFLKSNDLSYAKNIILCHLSDTNSNQYIMQDKVYEATRITTTIAKPGLNIELKLYLF
ncbi:MAG: MBL fold metallo-hydrolase [Clostridia bacterium]|jgi:phosphoribosyl 1,2-cyclic phosphodiesterase|nr:MBL fold metallo-hydrolase [Clostridia bacterium]